LPSKKSVVLVDDDTDILMIMKKGLEQNDYFVYDFDDPLKAVEYLKSVDSPELLITDIRMPGMSGFEVCRETRMKHPGMGIIVMTSFDIDKSEFERIFPSTKIDALIKKPFSIRKLVDAINAIYVSKR
jgi:two-component system, NtrC family, nitrogen regulation response regulator GlnG